jgi:hypothetical protein
MYSIKIIDDKILQCLQDGTYNHGTVNNPLFVTCFHKYEYINIMNVPLVPGEEYYVQASVIKTHDKTLTFHIFKIETYKEAAERISSAGEHLKG